MFSFFVTLPKAFILLPATLNPASMHPIINTAYLQQGMSYQAYRQLASRLTAEGKTSGTNQSKDLVAYSKLNEQRMHRLDKTAQLTEQTLQALAKHSEPQVWVLLTEVWCGDAAQSVPYIAKIAEANPHISLYIYLRDEHTALMDMYLRNGGRAIPMLISISADTFEEHWHSRARTQSTQAMVQAYKDHPQGEFKDFVEKLHAWYTQNKGVELQEEIVQLISSVKAI